MKPPYQPGQIYEWIASWNAIAGFKKDTKYYFFIVKEATNGYISGIYLECLCYPPINGLTSCNIAYSSHIGKNWKLSNAPDGVKAK